MTVNIFHYRSDGQFEVCNLSVRGKPRKILPKISHQKSNHGLRQLYLFIGHHISIVYRARKYA